MNQSNRQVALVRNPTGKFSSQDFELRDAPIPSPKEGEFLVRNLYLSLDPAMRIWAGCTDGWLRAAGATRRSHARLYRKQGR